jgi:hypothetical protein
VRDFSRKTVESELSVENLTLESVLLIGYKVKKPQEINGSLFLCDL